MTEWTWTEQNLRECGRERRCGVKDRVEEIRTNNPHVCGDADDDR